MAMIRARRTRSDDDFLDRMQRGRAVLTVAMLATALAVQVWSPREIELSAEHVGLSALLVLTALGVAPYERWMGAR